MDLDNLKISHMSGSYPLAQEVTYGIAYKILFVSKLLICVLKLSVFVLVYFMFNSNI